jgi:hypothetical protein
MYANISSLFIPPLLPTCKPDMLPDETVNSSVRVQAAYALGNFGEAGAKYVSDILNFLKDKMLTHMFVAVQPTY